jgi:hypothetical protein
VELRCERRPIGGVSSAQLHIPDNFTLVDDQNFGRQVHSHAPVQPALSIRSSQVRHQIVCRDEVRSESRLNRGFGQRHAQVRFAHAGRSQQNHVAGFVQEAQAAQFADLLFVDRGLKTEVEVMLSST